MRLGYLIVAIAAFFLTTALSAQSIPNIPLIPPVKIVGNANIWAISPDGSILFTSHDDSTIRVWDFIEGATHTVIMPKGVTDIRSLGGIPGALVRTSDGRVFAVRADFRHPLLVKEGVRAIATSAEGGFVAFLSDRSVEIARVGGAQSFEPTGVSYPVKDGLAVAVTADGLQVAVSTKAGGLTLYGSGNSPISLPDAALVAEMSYDNSDTWLIARTLSSKLHGSGKLYAIDMRRSAKITDLTKTLGEKSPDIINFDVRRRPDQTGPSPLVVATDKNNRVFVWSVDLATRELGSGRLAATGAQGAAFDPWADGLTKRIFWFAADDGTIALRGLGDGASSATPLLRMLPMEQDGWAAIDSAGRKDGEPVTLQGLKRAFDRHLKISKSGNPVDELNNACWQPGLLEDVRAYGGRVEPEQVRGGGTKQPIRCTTRAVPPRPVITIEPPRFEKGSGRYSIHVAISYPNGLAGSDTPALIHAGRLLTSALKRDSDRCGQSEQTCWVAHIRGIPGSTNVLYVTLPWYGRTARSDRLEFDVPPQTSPRRPMLHLITMAIDKYHDGACDPTMIFCSLEYPVEGAKRIRDEVSKVFGERSPYAVDTENITLINTDVTKEKFLTQLLKIRDSINPEDVVWIHFAGHAVLDSVSTDDLFFPQFGDSLKDFSTIQKARLSIRWIVNNLNSIEARTIIISIDACRAGGAGKLIDNWLENRSQANGGPLGILPLFSASEYEEAKDVAGGRGSKFTTAILSQFDSPSSLTTREMLVRVNEMLRAEEAKQDQPPGFEIGAEQKARNAEYAAEANRQSELLLGSDTLLLRAVK